ncbi:hypothetical protein [Nonomuraea sp. LPB2021202275-12-8]|uniref:hypothetical protein n=1 Tax=Nonomuraea sp. LPB2021202275-12-8 TaxID=3120159 RepID=UPI00300D3E37
MWLGSIGYWLVALLGPATVKNYAGLALGAVVVAGGVYVFRQRVYDRLLSRLAFPVTLAFTGTTVIAALYNMLLHPKEPGPLWAVAGVLVALIASAPLLYGALRMFRSTGDR